jgi:outer membrane protein assembly factor BamB
MLLFVLPARATLQDPVPPLPQKPLDPIPLLPPKPLELVPPLPLLAEEPTGVLWSVSLSAAPAAPPVIAGGRIFLSQLPGILAAHDITDGKELWRQNVNPEQPVAVVGEHVFVASGEEVFAMQASDRAIAWRTQTGAVTAPLLVKDGWVLAATAAKLAAIRASDGAVVWQRDAPPQRARAAIDGNTLFVPLTTGVVQAVDLPSGKVKWERPLGGVPAEPLVLGDRVYVGAADKYFYSLDASSGGIEWKIRIGSEIRGRATTDGERVFFAALDNLVRAVSRGSGAQRWQQGVPFRPFAGPVVHGDTVVVAGPVTEVQMLNAKTGRPISKVNFPEALVIQPAVGVLQSGETVLAGVSGGLNESWKLWLASPVVPQPKKIQP